MNCHPTRLPAIALALALLGTVPCAGAQTPNAAERCESEVTDTIRRMRGKDVQDVQYLPARRVLTPATDDETSVRGEGRYRLGSSAVSFTYSCAYNAKTDAASGALFRDVGGAPRAASEKPFEPDLTNISPDACESAAAGALKSRHPRVGRIVFGSDSRRIQPGSNGGVLLVGQGAVQRAEGMNAVPFSYRCEVNPRSGRVLDITTSD